MTAEWNIRQADIEEAHRRRPGRGGRDRRGRPGRPQSPRTAMARLAKAPQAVAATPDATSFWFKNGLVRVE